jgi:hypothetical protein
MRFSIDVRPRSDKISRFSGLTTDSASATSAATIRSALAGLLELTLALSSVPPPRGRNARRPGETLDGNVDDNEDTDADAAGECTPKEDAVLSKRRNEVAMASLIMMVMMVMSSLVSSRPKVFQYCR